MTRRLTILTLLLLFPTIFAGTVDARPRGGFGGGGFGGGFGRSRPSFSRPSTPSFTYRPRVRPPAPVAPPRATVPPPVTSTPPSTGGFGGGKATGIAGAPSPGAVPPSVPSSGAFGGGAATGVAGANAKKPLSSKPSVAPPTGAPGTPRGNISSRPAPAPAPGTALGNYRRVEPIRGSPNVRVYDNRPFWGFMPFWWYPPIYTPYGAMVSPGGANPLAILMTLLVVGIIGVMIYSAVRRN